MTSLRLVQLLLCLFYLTQTSVHAAKQICGCPDASNEGLFTDMPCQECPDGYYRPCTGGAYYAHHPTMCIYATQKDDFTHEEASEWCTKYDVSGFLAFAGDLEESYQISRTELH